MASNITIREMTPDDRDEILQFMEDEEFDPMYQNIGYAGFWGLEIEIDRPGEDFFRLAAIDSEGSAFGVLVGYKNDLLGIHVHKEYRRCGIAGQLFAAYCDELRLMGYRGVKTDATPCVKALCKAAGFTGFVSSRQGAADGEPTGYKMFKAFTSTLQVDDGRQPIDLVLRAFAMDDDRPDHRPDDCVEYQIHGFRQNDGSIQLEESIVLARVSERISIRPAFDLEIDGLCLFVGCIADFETKLVPFGFCKDPGGQYYLERLCPDLTHSLI